MVGTFTVYWPTAPTSLTPFCSVPPAWGNDSAGEQVLIKDGSGNTVGVTQLLTGTSAIAVSPSGATNDVLTTDASGNTGCSFGWGVTVPTKPFYSISIGSHPGPTYALDQMRAAHFTVNTEIDH